MCGLCAAYVWLICGLFARIISEPSPNLPRSFPVATPFLPRSYPEP